MEDCPVAMLVDLSEPAPPSPLQTVTDSPDEAENNENNGHTDSDDAADKENTIPLTDSIELPRSDENRRRSSLTLRSPLKIESRILKDITDETVGSQVDHMKNIHSPAVTRLLDEEVFDFDFVLSPSERNGDIKVEAEEADDAEVFFGPVGFSELCRAAVVAAESRADKPFSPLNPGQLAELVKEANTVAFRILTTKSHSSSDESPISDSRRGLSSSSDNTSSQGNGSFCSESSKSPRRHSRSGTFTINKHNLTSLPDTDRASLPVVNMPVGPLQYSDSEDSKSVGDEPHRFGIPKPTRLPKNRSFTNLNKTYSNESLDSGFSKKSNMSITDSEDAYETCSVNSDTSDVSLSKLPLGRPCLPKARVSAAPSKLSKMQPPSQRSKPLLERSFVKPQSNFSKSNLNCSLNFSASESHTDLVTNGKSVKKAEISNKLRYSGVKKASPGLCNGQPTGRGSALLKAPGSTVGRTATSAGQTGTSKESQLKGPATKSQLMNPGQLQKRSFAMKTNKDCTKKVAAGPIKAPTGLWKAPPGQMKAPAGPLKAPSGLMKPHAGSLKGIAGPMKGPLKATVPMKTTDPNLTRSADLGHSDSERPTTLPNCPRLEGRVTPVKSKHSTQHITPVKAQKLVQPKRLVPNSFSTPQKVRKDSASSVDSTRNIDTSLGFQPDVLSPDTNQNQNPCSFRSSVSSIKSVSDCDGDGPVFDDCISRPKSKTMSSTFTDVDDHSPSGMLARNPRVVNTPNLPVKKSTGWSPIRRPRALTVEDQAFVCTKRTASK
ncbi:hypothetical protein ScPMuIL_007513 [Solemya velum]